jgi:hypothetical protein
MMTDADRVQGEVAYPSVRASLSGFGLQSVSNLDLASPEIIVAP